LENRDEKNGNERFDARRQIQHYCSYFDGARPHTIENLQGVLHTLDDGFLAADAGLADAFEGGFAVTLDGGLEGGLAFDEGLAC
jgi:hypothetical protein